jgi:cobaltochelatase CobN
VTGVTLIPRDRLGRPRVDVMLTTSGTYRDHYPDVMTLIAKATQLAATSAEDDNPVRKAMTATETALRAEGTAAEDAARLARARVFAPAPGAYSPSIQFLAKSGDQRGDERKMAELYTSRLSHAYGEGVYGEASRPAFERQLARIDGASFARSDVVNGMLDNPMPAGFLGGLNLAAKAVTGRDIELYIDNLRDERNPTLESASAEIQRELRTRYFNKSWVAEMQTHGYEGARAFMYLTDHLDLWDTTATRTVASDDWREVKRVYVDDSLGVGMDGFFDRYNPHAQQVLLGNLLGAASRGQWEASAADKTQVASRLARSVTAHGIACEANMCRNPALTRLIADALEGTAEGAALLDGYTRALRAATMTAPTASEGVTTSALPSAAPAGVTPNRLGRTAPGQGRPSASRSGAAPSLAAVPRPSTPRPSAPKSSATMVTGRLMENVAQPAAPAPSRTNTREMTEWLLLASVSAASVILGWLRQARFVVTRQ